MVLILGGLHNPAQSYFNPHYHEITHPKGFRLNTSMIIITKMRLATKKLFFYRFL